MQVALTKPLFAWDCLEDSPSLSTIKKFLDSIPDARLLESLRRPRGATARWANSASIRSRRRWPDRRPLEAVRAFRG